MIGGNIFAIQYGYISKRHRNNYRFSDWDVTWAKIFQEV
jgi:hypothetical protein